MNRTLPPLTSSQVVPSQDTTNWFDRQEFNFPAAEPATTSAHSCFAPVNYESGYAYPLIVWLHGPRSNEDELAQVMPLISTRNYVAISPRGTRHEKNLRGVYRWDESNAGIAEASERVDECLELAQQHFNVHPDRIFVAGHSTGGTMALRLGMEYPDRFAGAVSLGGKVPRGAHLLRNINQARELPLLLSVSPTEGVYSTDEVMDDLRFLHSAGLTLALRLYPEGDELTTVMFNDLNRWVMEQFCPTSTAAAS